MSVMTKDQDAFGQIMIDYLDGKPLDLIIERDDGYIVSAGSMDIYFADYKNWPARQKKAIRFVRGRVLDVGCGAGRCLLYLQSKGLDAVGIDISPLTVKACKRRGVRKVLVKSFTEINRGMGVFDSILLYGNNFAMFGNTKRAKWMLKKLYGLTPADGRIIAEACDPTDNPEHLEYHRGNRRRGRGVEQYGIRIRYKKLISPWMDILRVSEKEMKKILLGTGWELARHFSAPNDPYYTVVMEKTKR